MTVKELLAEVSALGFSEPLSLNVQTVSAINRAQRRMFSDRRITGEYSFSQLAKIPLRRISILRHNPGGNEQIALSGDALSVFAHGKGTLTVRTGTHEKTFDFNAKSTRISTLLDGSATVELGGSGANYYTDLVTYRGECEEDEIHDGSPTVKYSARALVSDFHSFVGAPTDGEGQPLVGASLLTDTLRVPYNYEGSICFCYLRAPSEITVADFERRINIPEDCKEALALLVASYVYLGCDAALAEKYSELYREAVAKAPSPCRVSYGSAYRDTNGWA